MNQSHDMMTLLDAKHNPCSPDHLRKNRMKKGKKRMSNEERVAALNEAGMKIPPNFPDWSTKAQLDWIKENGKKLSKAQNRKLIAIAQGKSGDVFKGPKGESVHEVILKQRDRDILEELIDRHGLEELIETIAEIAFEKEEHIEQGDNGATSLSKSWGKDAKALDTISARMAN